MKKSLAESDGICSVLHLRMSLLFRRKEFNVGWSWYRVFLRWFAGFSHSCIKWAPSEMRSIDIRNSDFIYVTKSLTESAGLFKSSLAIVKPPGSCMKAGFSNRKKMRFPIDFRMGIHIALWICFFFFSYLKFIVNFEIKCILKLDMHMTYKMLVILWGHLSWYSGSHCA